MPVCHYLGTLIIILELGTPNLSTSKEACVLDITFYVFILLSYRNNFSIRHTFRHKSHYKLLRKVLESSSKRSKALSLFKNLWESKHLSYSSGVDYRPTNCNFIKIAIIYNIEHNNQRQWSSIRCHRFIQSISPFFTI